MARMHTNKMRFLHSWPFAPFVASFFCAGRIGNPGQRSFPPGQHLDGHEVNLLRRRCRCSLRLDIAPFGAALPDPALATEQRCTSLPPDDCQATGNEQKHQKMLRPERHFAFSFSRGACSPLHREKAHGLKNQFASNSAPNNRTRLNDSIQLLGDRL